MQTRNPAAGSTFRIGFVAALAFGLATLAVSASHAGPTPEPGTPTPTVSPTTTPTGSPTATPTPTFPCDMACSLDKKCSVGGGGLQDACVAAAGEEVTYHYLVNLFGGYALVQVEDDKLGLIGQSSGETLTRTTTLSETTTNNAEMTLIDIEPGCICVGFDAYDQVTVTVPTPTIAPPTPTPTASPTAPPPSCEELHPVDTIYTFGKGQSATNNAKLSHAITGNIIDPGEVCSEGGACTAHRIPVCAGTGVSITSTDSSGGATNSNIGKGELACVGNVCSAAAVDVTEKFKSVSADGTDTDRISLLPQ